LCHVSELLLIPVYFDIKRGAIWGRIIGMVAQGVEYSKRMCNQAENDAVPGDRARREHGLLLSRIVFCCNATLILTLVFGEDLTGSVLRITAEKTLLVVTRFKEDALTNDFQSPLFSYNGESHYKASCRIS
jgi:hypothetical protein